jgi:hypothetical protein
MKKVIKIETQEPVVKDLTPKPRYEMFERMAICQPLFPIFDDECSPTESLSYQTIEFEFDLWEERVWVCTEIKETARKITEYGYYMIFRSYIPKIRSGHTVDFARMNRGIGQ